MACMQRLNYLLVDLSSKQRGVTPYLLFQLLALEELNSL
jgi:hypothetical protein